MAGRPTQRRAASGPRLTVLPGHGGALADQDTEAAVLGLVLVDPAATAKAIELGLTGDHFASEPSGRIYVAAVDLIRQDPPVPTTFATIGAALDDRGELVRIGGMARLAALEVIGQDQPGTAVLDSYVRRLIECAERRAEVDAARRTLERHGMSVARPGAPSAEPERARSATDAEIIARASEYVSLHPGHAYAPATDDFAGGVITTGREEGDESVLYRWAPHVTRRVLMQDTEGGAAPVVYTVALPDGRAIDVTHTEVRKGECWDKAGLPVNTRRHQGLMGDILTIEAAKVPAAIGTPRLGWHTLPGGELVYVRADGRCHPPELTGRIVPFDLPAGLDAAARPPLRVPDLGERQELACALLEIGTGTARGVLLLEVCRGLRSLGASLHSPRSTVVLEARNDAGKTSAATFARGVMFGLSYPPEPPSSTFRSTANRIAVDLATESDSPALLDDFTAAMQEDPLKARMATEALDTLLRMQADLQQARGRLTKDSRKMAGYYSHSFPGVTVETFPRGLYGSSVRRMVLYKWEAGELPVSVDGRYDPDTPGTLAWHYRRTWPVLRSLGDAVIALLYELGADGARELLIERDTHWTAVLTGDLVAAGAEITNMAQRAGPILTGAELAERVLSLPPATLTGPARAALLPHLLRQGELYREANAASADLAQMLGATIRESLYARRAHLASQADRVDGQAFPSLTAQAAGLREWVDREAGGTTWDVSSGQGVRLWGVEGEWIGAELPALHALLRASRDELWSRFSVEGLGGALLEAGGLMRSTQKGYVTVWKTQIGTGTAGRRFCHVARVPWGLVFSRVPACEDDGDGTGGTGGTGAASGGESSSSDAAPAVPSGRTMPEQAPTLVASSDAAPDAAPVPAVPPVPPVPPDDASPVHAYAREDPRPDLAEDAELWAAVLGLDMAEDVRGALRAARATGARLYRLPETSGPDGRPALHMEPRTGADAFADRAEWEAFRTEYLMPHAPGIAAVLAEAAAVLNPPTNTASTENGGADPVVPNRAERTRRGASRSEPADPGAPMAVLAHDGRVLGRSRAQRVDVGPGMLAAALEAVARAGGRQLVLAGRPSEWLEAPTAPRRRGSTSAPAGFREWPALEAAKRAGWTLTTYDVATGQRVAGVGAWTDARHPELVKGDRWLTVHVPEIEPTVRAMLDLEAGELLTAVQAASRALGRRWQEWEGRGFRELTRQLRPDADAVLTVAELPPASDQETDPSWDRPVAAGEWTGARLWVFDRSGSYLSGLGVAVGSGVLERLDQDQAQAEARAKQLRPGAWLVQLNGPDPMAARGLPPILDHPDRESWVPAPTLRLLLDAGASVDVRGASLFAPVGASFWRPVAERLAEARDQLRGQSGPGARVALEIVKATYTRGIQMLNREAGEAGVPWYRPDVHAAITMQARANLQRALGKAKVRPVAYVAKDSAAWLLPASITEPATAAETIGLRYGRRPGLWHESLTLPAEEVRALTAASSRPDDPRSRVRAALAARRGRSVPAAGGRSLRSVVHELVIGAKRNG